MICVVIEGQVSQRLPLTYDDDAQCKFRNEG
jgi:hypothetical protein